MEKHLLRVVGLNLLTVLQRLAVVCDPIMEMRLKVKTAVLTSSH